MHPNASLVTGLSQTTAMRNIISFGIMRMYFTLVKHINYVLLAHNVTINICCHHRQLLETHSSSCTIFSFRVENEITTKYRKMRLQSIRFLFSLKPSFTHLPCPQEVPRLFLRQDCSVPWQAVGNADRFGWLVLSDDQQLLHLSSPHCRWKSFSYNQTLQF